MTKEWSHLPNAENIDWVLETLEKDLEMWMIVWKPVWDFERRSAWDAAETAAQNASFGSLKSASWRAVSDAMLDAVWDAMLDAEGKAANGDAKWVMRGDVWRVVSGAIAALVAWDDSSKFLDMSVEEVTELARTGNHAAILLLPAVIVKNKLKEMK